MHNVCFDFPLQDWFDFEIPETSVDKSYILDCIESDEFMRAKPSSKIVWIGNEPSINEKVKSKKGKSIIYYDLTFHSKTDAYEISIEKNIGEWLLEILGKLTPQSSHPMTYNDIKKDFENQFEDFDLFWFSDAIETLREHELLVL
jgi:hypothetical protein